MFNSLGLQLMHYYVNVLYTLEITSLQNVTFYKDISEHTAYVPSE